MGDHIRHGGIVTQRTDRGTHLLAVRILRWKDPVLSPIGLAVLAGIVATQADGSIDFMAFTNQPYFMFFLSARLIAGMLRLLPPRPAPHFTAPQWE